MNGYNIYLRLKSFFAEALKWTIFGGLVFLANLWADFYYFKNYTNTSYYALCMPFPNGSLQCKVMTEFDKDLKFYNGTGPIIPEPPRPAPPKQKELET